MEKKKATAKASKKTLQPGVTIDGMKRLVGDPLYRIVNGRVGVDHVGSLDKPLDGYGDRRNAVAAAAEWSESVSA